MTKNAERSRKVKLKFIHTSDVHGSFFTRDHINDRPIKGGMARIYAYVQFLRKRYGDRLILMDGGDVLQGSPSVYYSNFIALGEKHLAAEVMNYMHYDVGAIGNHDIETGHAVYDRWISACRFPVVGANVVKDSDGQPYLRPYCMLEREGVRIAVLGLTTPAIPNWLPPELWSGLSFLDMQECARKWMAIIREAEHPDLIVGLFHSGKEGGIVTGEYAENAAFDVARNVPGFDLICYGHDHVRNEEVVVNCAGGKVVCCAPSSMAATVTEVDVELEIDKSGVVNKRIKGKIMDVAHFNTDEVHYMQRYFKRYISNTLYYIGQKIGTFARTITCEDAYFGPSAFVDLIHRVQLEVTGAQVSFAAPLSFAAEIRGGDVRIRDMFNLYRYENMLYTMRFSGHEIKGILEMSYGLWTQQMKTPEDHIMLMDYLLNDGQRLGFVNLAYNFDSAAGICYTVDVTRPYGDKISISTLADGTPFELDAEYTVATNSYRGNGGGELFTKGAGIPHEQLRSRLIAGTEQDLRHYLIEYISAKGYVDPQPLDGWRFVPEEWTEEACRRDRKILFGHEA